MRISLHMFLDSEEFLDSEYWLILLRLFEAHEQISEAENSKRTKGGNIKYK